MGGGLTALHIRDICDRWTVAARRAGRARQMGGYDASFFFVSLKANSSSSTLSRTTLSTH